CHWGRVPSSCFHGSSTAWHPGAGSSAGTGAGVFSSSSASAAACRRTVSTISMGTCSKYVSLFRIAAAPLAACNVAVLHSYGENLLNVFSLTQRLLRGTQMVLARLSQFSVDDVSGAEQFPVDTVSATESAFNGRSRLARIRFPPPRVFSV